MKIVLDTNIYIAAALYEGLSREVLDFIFENSSITLFVSEEILQELHDKLDTKFHWSDERINSYLDDIRIMAKLIDPQEKLSVISRDPDDNKILECAVDADIIVTLDQDLIKLKTFKGIGIIHPKTLYWTFPEYFKKRKLTT